MLLQTKLIPKHVGSIKIKQPLWEKRTLERKHRESVVSYVCKDSPYKSKSIHLTPHKNKCNFRQCIQKWK